MLLEQKITEKQCNFSYEEVGKVSSIPSPIEEVEEVSSEDDDYEYEYDYEYDYMYTYPRSRQPRTRR